MPCAAIWPISEIVHHPQLAHRDVMQHVEAPYGDFTLAGSGFRLAQGGTGSIDAAADARRAHRRGPARGRLQRGRDRRLPRRRDHLIRTRRRHPCRRGLDRGAALRRPGAVALAGAGQHLGGADSGRPASNGGAGAYSMPSWIACAVSAPAISATRVSAKSMPAVTPPPVKTLPSRTTRAGSGIAPNAGSRSRQAQWQAARLPRNSPAAPSTSEPVQTEVT